MSYRLQAILAAGAAFISYLNLRAAEKRKEGVVVVINDAEITDISEEYSSDE